MIDSLDIIIKHCYTLPIIGDKGGVSICVNNPGCLHCPGILLMLPPASVQFVRAPAVQRFTSFANQHQELKFYVTAIGCGIAGYNPEQIAPLFLEAAYLHNVYLPLSFWKIIMNVAYPNQTEEEQICDYLRNLREIN